MTRQASAPPADFEDEFVRGLTEIFETKIAFNQVLGLKITRLRPEGVSGRIRSGSDRLGRAGRIRNRSGAGAPGDGAPAPVLVAESRPRNLTIRSTNCAI